MADRLIERGVDDRLSLRLGVSRRQFGHGASNLLEPCAGVISWWQPLATTVAAERALVNW